jgi:hypothetical protein
VHNAQNAKLVLSGRYVIVTTVLWKLGLYVSHAEWRIELPVFVISTFLESYLEHLENLGGRASFQIVSMYSSKSHQSREVPQPK